MYLIFYLQVFLKVFFSILFLILLYIISFQCEKCNYLRWLGAGSPISLIRPFQGNSIGVDDNEKLHAFRLERESNWSASQRLSHTDTESRASLMRNRISVNSIKHTCLNIFFSFCNLRNAAIILAAHHEKSENKWHRNKHKTHSHTHCRVYKNIYFRPNENDYVIHIEWCHECLGYPSRGRSPREWYPKY